VESGEDLTAVDLTEMDVCDGLNHKVALVDPLEAGELGDHVKTRSVVSAVLYVGVDLVRDRRLIDVEVSVVFPEAALQDALSLGVPGDHLAELLFNHLHIPVEDLADLEVVAQLLVPPFPLF